MPGDVPVTQPSPAGIIGYGSMMGYDEIIGLILAVPGGPPPYPLQQVYPVVDEVGVHSSLAPDPDNVVEDEDDDVDSLDVVWENCEVCPYWYFTADHEAHLGLDPGDIYQVTLWGPVRVIDEFIHLGISEETDIDAFEFVWLEDPMNPPARCLALLYSVDEDDPSTMWDESGGLDPTMIFGSFMAGTSFPVTDPVTDPLGDDVDALTSWYRPFEPPAGACCLPDCNCAVLSLADCINAGGVWAGPGTDCSDNDGDGIADLCFTCVGDLNCDGIVDLNDLARLLSSYGQTSGMGWRDGDFDGDGDVDLNDLAALLARYGGC
jgi:hypothetical protein